MGEGGYEHRAGLQALATSPAEEASFPSSFLFKYLCIFGHTLWHVGP